MSLINDALKRAKDAQQDAPKPPNPGPPLRPVEDENLVRRSVGLVIPAALAIVALLILFLVWQYASRTKTAHQGQTLASEARARTLPGQTAPPATSPAEGAEQNLTPSKPKPADAAPATMPTQSSGANSTLAPAATSQAPEQAVAKQTNSSPVTAVKPDASSSNAPSNTTAVAVTEPVKPLLPKLQGIVFNPKRPSAVINGKTLFLGERVAGFRVTAIGKDTATIVGGGQTNVLMLEE